MAATRFEEKLRKQMLLKGLNQQKLARLSNVSDSEVSRILSGKSQPGLENAQKLAKAVGVSLDYLADDTLESDPASPEERSLLDLARALGYAGAFRILDTACLLGYEVAIRRLVGAEMKPIIEVGDARPPATAAEPTPNRANSA